MLGDGVSPAQARKAVGRLQTLDLAVELGTIRKNPCVGVKLPPMSHEEMNFLTADQVATLADGMPAPYDLMVRFAAYTGLRAGETAALRRRHLRLDDAKVVVLTAVSEVRGDLVEHDPKSYSSRRAVKLPGSWSSSSASTSATRHPTRPCFPRRRVARCAAATSTSGSSTRGARHAPRASPQRAISRPQALMRGAADRRRRAPQGHPAALGHSSITVTLDRYGHLFPSLDDALCGRTRQDVPDDTGRATFAFRALRRRPYAVQCRRSVACRRAGTSRRGHKIALTSGNAEPGAGFEPATFALQAPSLRFADLRKRQEHRL